MEHIEAVLAELLERSGLQEGIVDYQLFARWDEVVGDLSRRTHPLRVNGDVLWVHVENATLLQHMGFFAPRIVKRIREIAPETRIRRLKFTLRRGDTTR